MTKTPSERLETENEENIAGVWSLFTEWVRRILYLSSIISSLKLSLQVTFRWLMFTFPTVPQYQFKERQVQSPHIANCVLSLLAQIPDKDKRRTAHQVEEILTAIKKKR